MKETGRGSTGVAETQTTQQAYCAVRRVSSQPFGVSGPILRIDACAVERACVCVGALSLWWFFGSGGEELTCYPEGYIEPVMSRDVDTGANSGLMFWNHDFQAGFFRSGADQRSEGIGTDSRADYPHRDPRVVLVVPYPRRCGGAGSESDDPAESAVMTASLHDLLTTSDPDNRTLLDHIGLSLRRVGLGFLLALAIVLPLGIFIGALGSVRADLSTPGADGARSGYIPIATLVPLTMSWFGLDEIQKVVFLAMALGFMPMPWSSAVDAVPDVY